jgi:hypothetical protein
MAGIEGKTVRLACMADAAPRYPHVSGLARLPEENLSFS